MEHSDKEVLVAEFVGLTKTPETNLYKFRGQLYNKYTLKFSSSYDWLIFAIRKYLDIDYATVKNSESIDLIVMYKDMLRKRSVFTDPIEEIFELLVIAITEYNNIKTN